MDALQKAMNTFKQFDRKLDKIQADVNFHGRALGDLKSILTNLSACTILNADGKMEHKNTVRRTIASQCEDAAKKLANENKKTKRHNAIQPLPSPMKATILEKQYVAKLEKFNRNSPKQPHRKLSARLRKVEGQRKATTVRASKIEKKKTKLTT